MNDRIDIINITRHTYDRIADGYATKINDLVSGSWVGEFERQLLDEFLLMTGVSRARVLDIGCGSGRDTDYLEQKGAVVVGIDVSSGMLRLARRRVSSRGLCLMEMRNLGFSGGSFDGIWANGCIYHIPKTEFIRILYEAGRVLKPSGVFSFNIKAGSGEGLEDNPRSYEGGSRYYAYYAASEMVAYLERAGFEIIETRDYPRAVFDEEIIHFWTCRPG
jgi:SAM-dependent methyltransferase